jgi:TRAP-type C4-dicarboxylate transport system substrate-binding protein
MRSVILATALALFVAAPLPAAAEKEVKIKLGTMAPEGSPWFNTLQRIAQRWKEISGGKVSLKVYPGGVAGDEGDMVRKIRLGQLHAATVTGVGLGRIHRSTYALQLPMAMQSYEELDYVRDRIGPEIEKELEKGGVIVLQWGDAGWVHFFSKTKATTPDDLRKLKMFLWSGDPEAEAAWRAAKFNPVPMSATDVMSGLQTGLIDWYGTTPLFAMTSQWTNNTPNMVKLNWAPLNGGTIVAKSEWEKIDPELRPKLLAAAREEGDKLKIEVRKLGEDAVAELKKRGMNVYEPNAADIAEWTKVAEQAYPKIRGPVVPEHYFDEVLRLSKEYKAQKK